MENLISNTAFGKSLIGKHLSPKEYREIRDNYDDFLSLPLEKWMFVPCDDNGNILNNPVFIYTAESIKKLKGIEIEIAKEANKRAEQYILARERCLFEGWIFEYEFPGAISIKNNDGRYFSFYKLDKKIHLNSEIILHNIECLLKTGYNLQLTPTAIKQLGL